MKLINMPADKLKRSAIRAVAVFASMLMVSAGAGVAAAPSSDDNSSESLPKNDNNPKAHENDQLKLVEVAVKNSTQRAKLEKLPVDIASVDGKKIQILLRNKSHKETLKKAGFDWKLVPSTLGSEKSQNRKKHENRRNAEKNNKPGREKTALPSGRDSYRHLDEVNADLRKLARENPDTVKLIKLDNRTLLGKEVLGVEVSHDVNKSAGKPEFLLTGETHAREWPTAELTLEFAYDLVKHDGKKSKVTSLLEHGRLVAVPVVNPDGYQMSREYIHEQKRKNCRVEDGETPTFSECADTGNSNLGVDLNRNYGVFWGGPGTSTDPAASNYRGSGPVSEPAIENMDKLFAKHQFSVSISNHTPDERVLRAPSAPNEPDVAEEDLYQGLADELGEIMDWPAGPWPEIYYNASGTAEQDAFYKAGTLAFTFENTPGFKGLERFHPPFEYVVNQYYGQGKYIGSNARKAFVKAFEAAVDDSTHSIIKGEATPGSTLTIQKKIPLFTSAVEDLINGNPGVIPFDSTMTSKIKVPKNGKFNWHVTPSTRPSQSTTALMQEAWTISCEAWDGGKEAEVEVSVDRGETKSLNTTKLRKCSAS